MVEAFVFEAIYQYGFRLLVAIDFMSLLWSAVILWNVKLALKQYDSLPGFQNRYAI